MARGAVLIIGELSDCGSSRAGFGKYFYSLGKTARSSKFPFTPEVSFDSFFMRQERVK
jgi:hypothetical protein